MTQRAFNVLVIIHAPVFGGPHATIATLAGPLAQVGINTTVILPDDADVAASRLRAAGVDVITMPLHRVRARLNPRHHIEWARSIRREVRAIAGLIDARGIDVVLTNSLPNLHGALAARRSRVACIWALIDSFPPSFVRLMYMPLVLRLADVVMTTGSRIARQHYGTTLLGERWVTFFPPVDGVRFVPRAQERTAARRTLGIDDSRLVVGNVANINPMKGHRYFIEAAAAVRATNPDTVFVILGALYDHYADYLSALVARAEELGLQVGSDLIIRDPGPNVAELAQSFDVFWVTSEPRSEGIPTVIGEAKALGLPVVATDAGSTREAITDGLSGFVVPPRAPQRIAAATRPILDDPARRSAMSRASSREAALYSVERGVEAHREAVVRAVDHARTRRARRRVR